MGQRTRATLADLFDPRDNSLNALRLVLAALVIVSHSWPIGGFGDDPQLGDLNLGAWAVAGFFAISGWLITGSRLSTGLADYLWRRVLRIYPAYWVCLVVVAFAFAPLSQLIGPGTFHPVDGLSYVASNVTLAMHQGTIGNTLASVPFPEAWDGSLWTLFYEFLCYLLVASLITVLPRWLVSAGSIFVFVGCALVQAAIVWGGLAAPAIVDNASQLFGFFFAGAVLYLFRTRIPVSTGLATFSVAVLTVLIMTRCASVLAGLPVAYLVLWLGVRLPLRRVGRPNDVSYGVYIYGFPVQQTLVLMGAARLGVLPFVLLSLALTVPLAVASWFLVERPAMRRRKFGAALGTRLSLFASQPFRT
jgi:peptidoglycan/LPS O-acetylase OafA/YrhL